MSNLSLLNGDQRKAFDLICKGENVCIFGRGGYGKSFLIEVIKEEFPKGTYVLSTTGISAVNIGGKTMHSGLSLPIGHPTRAGLSKVSQKVASLFSKKAVKRIIIDEASMIGPGSMYGITQRLKKLGAGQNIQIILVMDLGQNGAILKPPERKLAKQDYKTDKFYRMRQFEDLNFKYVELCKSERQSDPEFIEMLGRIRRGKRNAVGTNRKGATVWEFDKEVVEAVDYFNKHCADREIPENNIILATRNNEVDRYNERIFHSIIKPVANYGATINGDFCKKDEKGEYIEKDVPTKINLFLKEGLKAIILKNDVDGEYVNGSTGTLTGFTSDGVYLQLDSTGEEVFIEPNTWTKHDYKVEPDMEGADELVQYVSGSFTQIPVKQCAAISVHRAQGQTLGKTTVDWGKGAGWCTGLCYVSLSRVSKKEDMFFKRPLTLEDIKVDYDALEWLEEQLAKS